MDKVTLKGVKYFAAGSRETNCFTADVYIDGEYAGAVENDGQGGADRVYSPNNNGAGAGVRLDARLEVIAAALPPYAFMGEQSQHNAETMIGELFGDWLVAKDLKVLLRKRVLILRRVLPNKDNVKAVINQTSAMAAGKLKQTLAIGEANLKDAYEADEVLNLLPFTKALELYKQYAVAS